MGWTPPPLDGISCAKVGARSNHLSGAGASTMKITTVGIDLAKNVFQVHGVDERGKAVLKKQLKRHQLLVFFSNVPACLPPVSQ